METMALEVLDPRDAGQLRPVEGTRRHHHEAGADVVTAVGADPPTLDRLIPAQGADLSGEDGGIVETEVLTDSPAMLINFGAIGEFPGRHVVEFFEQRHVAVRVVVALDPGETVPVPDAPEVSTHFNDPHILDADLLQRDRRQQTGETPAENGNVDLLGDRVADHWWCVRIDFGVLGEFVRQLHVLLRTVRAQSLVTLLAVPFPQRGKIDVVRRLRRTATFGGRLARHVPTSPRPQMTAARCRGQGSAASTNLRELLKMAHLQPLCGMRIGGRSCAAGTRDASRS